jgi:hypothetical protein
LYDCFEGEKNLWSKVPDWAWHQDILTGWPSVVMWLWLWGDNTIRLTDWSLWTLNWQTSLELVIILLFYLLIWLIQSYTKRT